MSRRLFHIAASMMPASGAGKAPGVLLRAARAAIREMRAQHLVEALHPYRLRQIVVHAGVETELAIARQRVRGHGDHQGVALAASRRRSSRVVA